MFSTAIYQNAVLCGNGLMHFDDAQADMNQYMLQVHQAPIHGGRVIYVFTNMERTSSDKQISRLSKSFFYPFPFVMHDNKKDIT